MGWGRAFSEMRSADASTLSQETARFQETIGSQKKLARKKHRVAKKQRVAKNIGQRAF